MQQKEELMKRASGLARKSMGSIKAVASYAGEKLEKARQVNNNTWSNELSPWYFNSRKIISLPIVCIEPITFFSQSGCQTVIQSVSRSRIEKPRWSGGLSIVIKPLIVCQSVTQSIGQSVTQSYSQSVSWSVSKSFVSNTVSQSVSQSFCLSFISNSVVSNKVSQSSVVQSVSQSQ